MHRSLAAIAFVCAILAAATASAERRMFIIANNADGYGVDRCLATGAACGSAIATAYCRARAFDRAVSFRKVDKSDITGAVPSDASGGCRGHGCDEYVAIECSR